MVCYNKCYLSVFLFHGLSYFIQAVGEMQNNAFSNFRISESENEALLVQVLVRKPNLSSVAAKRPATWRDSGAAAPKHSKVKLIKGAAAASLAFPQSRPPGRAPLVKEYISTCLRTTFPCTGAGTGSVCSRPTLAPPQNKPLWSSSCNRCRENRKMIAE